jgi:hypothetical protein
MIRGYLSVEPDLKSKKISALRLLGTVERLGILR